MSEEEQKQEFILTEQFKTIFNPPLNDEEFKIFTDNINTEEKYNKIISGIEFVIVVVNLSRDNVEHEYDWYFLLNGDQIFNVDEFINKKHIPKPVKLIIDDQLQADITALILFKKIGNNRDLPMVFSKGTYLGTLEQVKNSFDLLDKSTFYSAPFTKYDHKIRSVMGGLLYLQSKHSNECIIFNYSKKFDKLSNIGVTVDVNENDRENFSTPYISNYIANEFKKCINNPFVIRFITVLLIIKCYKPGKKQPETHVNFLIYDKQTKTMERFEPNGAHNFDWCFGPEKLDEKIWLAFRDKGISIDYYFKPVDFCPDYGLQVYQHSTATDLNKYMDPIGYCAVWSLWYADLRLSFPNVERNDVINIATDHLNNSFPTNVTLTSFIRGYSDYITVMGFDSIILRLPDSDNSDMTIEGDEVDLSKEYLSIPSEYSEGALTSCFIGSYLDVTGALLFLQQKHPDAFVIAEIEAFINQRGSVSAGLTWYGNLDGSGEMIDSPHLIEYMIKGIQSNSRFIVFSLDLRCKGQEHLPGHANIVIIDRQNKVLEHYEPHGQYGGILPLCYSPPELYLNIAIHLNRRIPGFYNPDTSDNNSVVNIIRTQPSVGVIKGLQNFESSENNPLEGDPGGFCVMWSIFYADIRLSNPNMTEEDSSKYAVSLVYKKSKEPFRNIIRGYTKYIEELNRDDLISDYLDKHPNQKLETIHNQYLANKYNQEMEEIEDIDTL